MRGKTRVDDVDNRILVLNWIRRRSLKEEEEVGEKEN